MENACVCAGRRLAGVKRLWIYQLPNEGQKRCLPDPTISHTHAHTQTRKHTYTSCLGNFFFILLSCVCLHQDIYFLTSCCFIVSSILLLHLFVVPWMDSEHYCHSSLKNSSILFSLSSHPSRVFIYPYIFLLFRLCHWHSRQVTDAGQKVRGRRRKGDIEEKRGEKKKIEGEARLDVSLLLCSEGRSLLYQQSNRLPSSLILLFL